MKYMKKESAGGTISRHCRRLAAFGGAYTYALAGALVSGTDPEKAHTLALDLVAGGADPDVAVGEFSDGKVVYTSRSGKKYVFSFPEYREEGEEFFFPADSSLAAEFSANPHPQCGEIEA